MQALSIQIDLLQQFLEAGGIVLKIILVTSICLWCLIAERLIFFRFSYPQLQQQWLELWQHRNDKSSPYARSIRQEIISQAKIALQQTLPIIKMLIAICPMMGLLGTVTGMIHVFDVMAVTGNGNARAMADGVSQATMPTMAGMVIAIAGLYFSRLIEQRIHDEVHHLSDLLHFH